MGNEISNSSWNYSHSEKHLQAIEEGILTGNSFSYNEKQLERGISVLKDAELFSKLKSGSKLKDCNNVELSGSEHLDNLLVQVKELTQSDAEGFRRYGSSDGVTYEIHDKLTNEGKGYGFFRLTGTFKNVSPELWCAIMLDGKSLGRVDPTLRFWNSIHNFDNQKSICYWKNYVAPFLNDVDGVDLTAYHREEDGTMFQYSYSVPHELPKGERSDRGIDKCWGYKLVENEDGSLHVVLLCQTLLSNSIPKFFIKRKTGQVLAHYMKRVETVANKMDEEEKKMLVRKYITE